MSKFVVSARKYRPQRFDEVVGQEHVSQTFKNALQNDQLAHAFLFCGPRGVGKTTCARILAKVLNCEKRTADFEACDQCGSCTSFNANSSFNITELDAASNNSVEHIRALIEQVRFQPQQGEYKIFIIDEVHMLSTQAFNAFLKTLEEPPPYAIFILATTEKHKIIPTILSRCQIYDFKRIQIPRIVEHLQHICQEEGIDAEKDALHIIAQKADGALRDALSIFDRMASFSSKKITYDSVIENLNVLDYDYYFKVVDAMLTEDTGKLLMIFDEIFKKGFEPDIFINGLAEHLRNLLVCKDTNTIQLLETSDNLKTRYLAQCSIAPNSFILTALNIAADCDVNYKMARHKRLHVEMAIIKMAYIGRAIEISKSPTTLAVAEKKTPDVRVVETPTPVKAPKAQPVVSPPIPSKVEKVKENVENTVVAPSSNEEESTAVPAKEDMGITHEMDMVETEEHSQSMVNEPESTQEPTAKRGSLKLNKKSKHDVVSLKSLDFDEDDEEAEGTTAKQLQLTLPLIEKSWAAYIDTLDSPSVKVAFQKAAFKVKDAVTFEVEVGSQMAKGMIQQEKELIPFLRNLIPITDLAMEVVIDADKVKELVVTKKVLSTNEIYEMMREKNANVHELRLRLDLKPDH